MKNFIASASMLCVSASGSAAPSAFAIEACMKVDTIPGRATYKEWIPLNFGQAADEAPHRKEVLCLHEKEMIGLWENSKTKTWGLSYNGRDIPQKSIVRLDRRQAPYEFEPYKAIWGEVMTGKQRFICITFNFDGLGRSGSYQDIRGIYLIEPKAGGQVYYTAGNVASFPK